MKNNENVEREIFVPKPRPNGDETNTKPNKLEDKQSNKIVPKAPVHSRFEPLPDSKPKKPGEIIDFSKLETLLKAERLTLAAHPDWPPFLGRFIQLYETDPERALMYFTANAPDGTNARRLVASLDLSNIKNEVLTAISIYLARTRRYRNKGALVTMMSTLEDNPNYDCNNGRNMETLTTNRFSEDLEKNTKIINSTFDAYLEKENVVTSEYIDSYIETISALKDNQTEQFNSSGWFDERNYPAEYLKDINAILHGKRTSIFKPRITKAYTTGNKK